MIMSARAGISALFLVAFVGLTLAAPASVAACICQMSYGPGEVVFTGTVTDVEQHPSGGAVYTFWIDEVVHGDPHGGRVYVHSPVGGDCGFEMLLGARYLVDARVVDPDAPYRPFGIGGGAAPTVPLAIKPCSATEQLGLPNPLIMVTALGTPGLATGLVGLAAICLHAFRRRRSEGGE